jgi:hypothetical protein
VQVHHATGGVVIRFPRRQAWSRPPQTAWREPTRPRPPVWPQSDTGSPGPTQASALFFSQSVAGPLDLFCLFPSCWRAHALRYLLHESLFGLDLLSGLSPKQARQVQLRQVPDFSVSRCTLNLSDLSISFYSLIQEQVKIVIQKYRKSLSF